MALPRDIRCVGERTNIARHWASRFRTRLLGSYKLDLVRKALTARSEAFLEYSVRPPLLRARIHHVHGPRTIEYERDQLLVLCVVRNGAQHVAAFLEHHLSLGATHIVLLDNDSTDDTIDLARGSDRVTILRTSCPYRVYETPMKRYLVDRFSRDRWALIADIDERFDYPFSDVLGVRELLAYLNQHSYTAVVGQMLDLFSDCPVRSPATTAEDSLHGAHVYYDISNIRKTHYGYGILSNSNVKMHSGGIRKTVFGTDNGLTKAALVRASRATDLFASWHHAEHAVIADFTGVLLHYPFFGPFYEKVREAVQTSRYGTSAGHEYIKYWTRLKDDPELCLKRDTASIFTGVNALLDTGFLTVSPQYLRWVDAAQTNPGPRPTKYGR